MVGAEILALEGGASLISPDGSLIVIFVLFIILVFVLDRILFKPIGQVLDQRERRTEGARSEARAAVKLSEARAIEFEDALRQARAESFQLLQRRRASAVEDRNRLLAESREKASAEINSAKSEIANQAAEAKQTLERDAKSIAAQISSSVLGRTIEGGVN